MTPPYKGLYETNKHQFVVQTVFKSRANFTRRDTRTVNANQ